MKQLLLAILMAPAVAAGPGPGSDATGPMARLSVRVSWGHRSPTVRPWFVRLRTQGTTITDLRGAAFEDDHAMGGVTVHSHAGAGDVAGVTFVLHHPARPVQAITNVQEIWRYLLAHSDPQTVRRLQSDPAHRPDPRKLTIELNETGTDGFSVTVDQLETARAFWMPELDMFLTAGEGPPTFEEHQRALAAEAERRVLDRVAQEPEAGYRQFADRWEDMGSPVYHNPKAVPPGHIVCVTWDSALYKFGIDRWANVQNDYGALDRFRLGFELDEGAENPPAVWKSQTLHRGLPVLTTTLEKAGVRYEIEQFAYPLRGPPAQRRGDMPMVLLAKVKVTESQGQARDLSLRLSLVRQIPGPRNAGVELNADRGHSYSLETADHRSLLALEGPSLGLQLIPAAGDSSSLTNSSLTHGVEIRLNLRARGSREFVTKLPSPLVTAADRARFLGLDYARCREATLRFWETWLTRGAQFEVPEAAVNELFRASLWHALRLPRRHGGEESDVRIDLPYSNFAYDQKGSPWPVNQAVYVDYMLFDLRGYHDLSAEDLAVMFRDNQQTTGRIGGFANWGVYTPAMLYAVANHYLLAGDRQRFESLRPQTLRALDWCLEQLRKTADPTRPEHGLVLAPLNDLSHEPRAWAFNQAYFAGALELLGRALTATGHPRAAECRAAAETLRRDIARAFGRASVAAPLVQLRDRTWIPYVPADALTPGRRFESWYPTDVDTGALHLPRLNVLPPAGALTTYLLLDHEDNLFLHGWGMANEPVYNPQAIVYLRRDDPKAAIRAFYSMMACAFSQSVREPVEHRWGWGQYFGPPSTDGAWFELYRHMLLCEQDDDALLLFAATPRRWLEDGRRIRVGNAPTYYGPVSTTLESRASKGEIRATVELRGQRRPAVLLVRFRHPEARELKSARVNGRPWGDFEASREWVRIPHPKDSRYRIVAHY